MFGVVLTLIGFIIPKYENFKIPSILKIPYFEIGCNLKNDRMISVRFQGKPFNIMVIQVYAPTSDAEEAEVEEFYEETQDLLELTHTHTHKRCPFHHRGLECKSRKSRHTWNNR